MNVLNIAAIERELLRLSRRALHPNAERWMLSVPRNYLLGVKITEKDRNANFREVVFGEPGAPLDQSQHRVDVNALPGWAVEARDRGDKLYWFDDVQPRRRDFWSMLEIIVLWFNNMKPEDTRLRRLDRISAPVAIDAAALWYKDVSANIWNYVTDKPVTLLECANGYRWVKLVTALQFEREGKLMGHCVGNGSYYNNWRTNGLREYYSLRDGHNNPHATLEVAFNSNIPGVRKGSIMQCKGKQNVKPDKAYQPYIRELIKGRDLSVHGDHHHIDG